MREAHRILQQLNDGETAAALLAARGLERRIPREDASADAAWRSWALRAHIALVDRRPQEAREFWTIAIGFAKTADVCVETLSSLLVDACYASKAHDAEWALLRSEESVGVLAALPTPNRTRGAALLSECECLLVLERPAEAVAYARRSLDERLGAGAPRTAVLWSQVTLARALLSADNFTEAREVARMADVERVGLHDTQHVLPTLRRIQATLALKAKDFAAFERAVRDWVAAQRAIGLLETRHVQLLRDQAGLIRDKSPATARNVDTLAAEVEAELAALAARRLRPRP